MANQELNLQAKWYNAHKNARAVQEIINFVADNYANGEIASTVYQDIMVALCKIRDPLEDIEEQLHLLKSIEAKRERGDF